MSTFEFLANSKVIYKRLLGYAKPYGSRFFMGVFIGFVPLMVLIKGLLTCLHQYCMLWVGNKVLYQLRDGSFTSLVNQSLKF